MSIQGKLNSGTHIDTETFTISQDLGARANRAIANFVALQTTIKAGCGCNPDGKKYRCHRLPRGIDEYIDYR